MPLRHRDIQGEQGWPRWHWWSWTSTRGRGHRVQQDAQVRVVATPGRTSRWRWDGKVVADLRRQVERNAPAGGHAPGERSRRGWTRIRAETPLLPHRPWTAASAYRAGCRVLTISSPASVRFASVPTPAIRAKRVASFLPFRHAFLLLPLLFLAVLISRQKNKFLFN